MADPDDLNPKNYSGITGDEQVRDIEALFANLNKTDVVFYPGSGLNWQPLHSFRHQYRVFVYCDWSTRWANFNGAIDRLDDPTLVERPSIYIQTLVEAGITRRIGRLPAMTQLPWRVATPDGSPIDPWCGMVKLCFRDGDPISLLFIAGDPIETYRKLFTSNQTAPKLVYLRQQIGVPPEAWGAFVADGGPLATVIHDNPHRPRHVLNDIAEEPLG